MLRFAAARAGTYALNTPRSAATPRVSANTKGGTCNETKGPRASVERENLEQSKRHPATYRSSRYSHNQRFAHKQTQDHPRGKSYRAHDRDFAPTLANGHRCRVCRDQPNGHDGHQAEKRGQLHENTIATQNAAYGRCFRSAAGFCRGIGELLINRGSNVRNHPRLIHPNPKVMRDPRVTGGFLKIVKSEDQEAGHGSLGDGTDNSQRDIEWIDRSPELDLLTNMEIEAAHCALRHQARGFDLFELVHAGQTPIGPHVNLLRFRSNAWKLIADLMVNAAVNHERCNGNDVGNRGNFELVSFGQRITQSHLGAGEDANGGGCISEHLVGKSWETHQHCKNKQRNRNRKGCENSSAFATQQILENQECELRHVSSSPTAVVATRPLVWPTSRPAP